MAYLRLEDLIERLSKRDPMQVVKFGFGRPCSYRMDYSDLAFEPAQDVTVGSMLMHARNALGNTFEGWKGGDFEMGPYTEVYIAESGMPGDAIGDRLLGFMLDGEPTADVWMEPYR